MAGNDRNEATTPDTSDLTNKLDVFVVKDADKCLNLIKELSSVVETSDGSMAHKVEGICEQFEAVISKWQTNPKLIECHLNDLLSPIIEIVTSCDVNGLKFNGSFQMIQRLAACVGPKSICRYFPTEVLWLTKLIDWSERQTLSDSKSWHTRHVLLLWLSMAVKTPFHLRKFDSNDENDKQRRVLDRIYDLIETYLKVNDKSRDSAALLAANFLTRPDVIEEQFLDRFMNQSLNHLDTNFGHVIALAILFKMAKRTDINQFSERVIEIGTKLDTSRHELMTKWKVKLVGRSALSLMAPRIANWRYRRGRRLLSQNISLQQSEQKQEIANTDQNGSAEDMEDDCDYSDIPDQIEVIIDSLLKGLNDPNTIVRWSAAKYLARLTNRLPKELAADIVSHVLQLCQWKGSDSSWHGSCLALAELARRGLILTPQLPDIIGVVQKALVFDQLKGTFSVGAHVRDSACFVCWSLSRAYEPHVLEKFVHQLAPTLVSVTCFDREVNCRRAASAAIQEIAGRTQVFPHGLEILVLTDFHLLANRSHCYLDTALKLAEKPEFGESLVEYLVDKCQHWDRDIREIAAQSLGRLSTIVDVNPYITDLLSKSISLDLNSRHGSILSIAHIIGNIGHKLESKYIEQIENIGQTLNEKKLLKGIGGEFMKQALSALIEKCSSVAFPVSKRVFDFWIEMLCESLTSEDAKTRKDSVEAVSEFCRVYLKNEEELKNRVLNELFKHLNSTKESARIGSSESIRLMSVELLTSDYYDNCFYSIVSHIKSGDLLCFSRASEVITLVELALKFMPVDDNKRQVIVDCLCLALDDRSKDQRGDIGGNVRFAAIEASLKFIDQCSNEDVIRILKLITTQSVSNWQKERRLGSTAFKQIVFNRDLDGVDKELISSLFAEEDEWKPFVRLLKVELFTYDLWLGLVKSVANPTETRVRNLVKLELKTSKPYVFDRFLAVFENGVHSELLSQNLLNCSHFLLSSCRTTPEFCTKVVSLTWTAVRKTRDCNKLVAAVDVFCTALQLSSFKQAMGYLVMLLVHTYPRIRSQTANQLYVALLTADDISEEAIALLTDTDWTQPLTQLRPIRDRFCDAIGVPKPKKIAANNQQ